MPVNGKASVVFDCEINGMNKAIAKPKPGSKRATATKGIN
jgi:hypothetical protein